MNKSFLLTLGFAFVLSGCKIIQSSTGQGQILSKSGENNCPSAKTCIVDLADGEPFVETFTAKPAEGYHFVGWGKGLCAAKIGPCNFIDGSGVWTQFDYDVSLHARFSRAPLSVGGDHACVIRGDNVYCWGDNTWGQTDVPPLVNPTLVMASTYNSCALDDTGVVCWGAGEPTPPLDYPSISGVESISAGAGHFCAIVDNSVICWGDNETGQLNVPSLTNAEQVGSGDFHSCALDATGVICWGSDIYLDEGQADPPELINPNALAVGGTHSCAIDETGVVCWGDNRSGQLEVPALRNPRKISAGSHHSCALDDDGVKCWGAKSWDGRSDSWPNSGQADTPALGQASDIFAQENYSCALLSSGWRCWGGFNESGLSDHPIGSSVCFIESGNIECRNRDIREPSSVGSIQQFDQGDSYVCATDEKGLKCWPFVDEASVGTFPNGGQSTPPDDLKNVTDLYANFLSSCAKSEGNIQCWKSTPQFFMGLQNPKMVSSGWDHRCALDENGVTCSGGEIANIPSLIDPTSVAVGTGSYAEDGSFGHHACAIHDGGKVSCWGLNEGGQASPPPIEDAKMVIAGFGFSCALTNEVICWGGSAPTTKLHNPSYISAGAGFFACALDDKGVHCWNTDGAPVYVPPELRAQ